MHVYYIRDDVSASMEGKWMRFLLDHGVTITPIPFNQSGYLEPDVIVVRVFDHRLSIVKTRKNTCNIKDKLNVIYEYMYVDPNPIEWYLWDCWCPYVNPNPFDMTKHRLPLLEGVGPIVQGLAVTDEMKRE